MGELDPELTWLQYPYFPWLCWTMSWSRRFINSHLLFPFCLVSENTLLGNACSVLLAGCVLNSWWLSMYLIFWWICSLEAPGLEWRISFIFCAHCGGWEVAPSSCVLRRIPRFHLHWQKRRKVEWGNELLNLLKIFDNSDCILELRSYTFLHSGSIESRPLSFQLKECSSC